MIEVKTTLNKIIREQLVIQWQCMKTLKKTLSKQAIEIYLRLVRRSKLINRKLVSHSIKWVFFWNLFNVKKKHTFYLIYQVQTNSLHNTITSGLKVSYYYCKTSPTDSYILLTLQSSSSYYYSCFLKKRSCTLLILLLTETLLLIISCFS